MPKKHAKIKQYNKEKQSPKKILDKLNPSKSELKFTHIFE